MAIVHSLKFTFTQDTRPFSIKVYKIKVVPWRNLIMNERSILICLFQSHDSWNCIVRYVAITIFNRLRTNKLFSHASRGKTKRSVIQPEVSFIMIFKLYLENNKTRATLLYEELQSHDSWNCIVRYVAITIFNRLRTNKLFSHASRGNNSCKTHDFRIKVGTVQLVNSFKRKNVFCVFFFLFWNL
jgi:hypothetical protein